MIRRCLKYDLAGNCILYSSPVRDGTLKRHADGYHVGPKSKPVPPKPKPVPPKPKPVPPKPKPVPPPKSKPVPPKPKPGVLPSEDIGQTSMAKVRSTVSTAHGNRKLDTLTKEEKMEAKIVESAYINSYDSENGFAKAQKHLDDNKIPYEIDTSISNDRTLSLKKRSPGVLESAKEASGNMANMPLDKLKEHYVASRGLELGDPANRREIVKMLQGDRDTVNYKKASDVYNKTAEKYGVDADSIRLVGQSEGGGHSNQLARETGSEATVFNAYITPDHTKQMKEEAIARKVAQTASDKAQREAGLPLETVEAPGGKVKSIRTMNDVVSAPHTLGNLHEPDHFKVKTVREINNRWNPRESHALKNFTNAGEANFAEEHQTKANEALREAHGRVAEMAHIWGMKNSQEGGLRFTDYVAKVSPIDVEPSQWTKRSIEKAKEAGTYPTERFEGGTTTLPEASLARIANRSAPPGSTPRQKPPASTEPQELQDMSGRRAAEVKRKTRVREPDLENRRAVESRRQAIFDDVVPGTDYGSALGGPSPKRLKAENLSHRVRGLKDLWEKSGGTLTQAEQQHLSDTGVHSDFYKGSNPSSINESGVASSKHTMSDKEISSFADKRPSQQKAAIESKIKDIEKPDGLHDTAQKINTPNEIIAKSHYDTAQARGAGAGERVLAKAKDMAGGALDYLDENTSQGTKDALSIKGQAEALLAGAASDSILNIIDPKGQKTHPIAYTAESGALAGGLQEGISTVLAKGVSQGVKDLAASGAAGMAGMGVSAGSGAVGALSGLAAGKLAKGAVGLVTDNKDVKDATEATTSGGVGLLTTVKAAPKIAEAGKAVSSIGRGSTVAPVAEESTEAAGEGFLESVGGGIAEAEEMGGLEGAAETGGLSAIAALGIGATIGGLQWGANKLWGKQIGQAETAVKNYASKAWTGFKSLF